MYFCYVHNWSSQTYSCPSCHKVDTFTSDKVCIDYNPNDNHAEYLKLYNKYQQLKNASDKLVEALEFWDRDGCCGDAMDGDYLGDHMIEKIDNAIKQYKKDVWNE